MLKKISLYGLLSFFIMPFFASAHVKWFVDEEALQKVEDENTAAYALAWIIITLILLAIGFFLEKITPALPHKTKQQLLNIRPKAFSIFNIVIGLFLLLAAYNSFVFSPNLTDTGAFHAQLLALEVVVGLSFILGAFVRSASILLILMGLFTLFYVGPLETIENMDILGFAVFFLIYGRPRFKLLKKEFLTRDMFSKWREYPLPVLRVVIGANLILLGFTEKLLAPELGLGFLAQHDWNFMQNLGIDWYSDYLFVFSAGATEAILGLFLVLGLMTRLTTVVLAIFFAIPIFMLGPMELMGHLPHIATAVIILIFGAGTKLRLTNLFPNL